MNSEVRFSTTLKMHTPAACLAEPYAFALLCWPVILGLASGRIEDWAETAPIAAWLWLVLLHATAYTRGLGFGNAILLVSGIVTLAYWMFPSAWAALLLPALLVGLLTAQTLALRAAK